MLALVGSPLTPQDLGLPVIPGVSCPGGSLDVLCTATGLAGGGLASAGAGVAAAGASAVLGAFTSWVVGGAAWMLDRIGDVLSATTSVDVGAHWFTAHFSLMAGVAGVVVLPMVLLAVVQAVYRQSAGMLLRSLFVHLPLAALLTLAALQLVQMGLEITDGLSATVASGTGADLHHLLGGAVAAMVAASQGSGFPEFVLLMGALLVAFGAFVLWVELLVRAAAVYVAVLFLPLVLASLVWPAVSHWCRRLVETIAALILSKFVIVTILSLAVSALGSGTAGSDGGFATVLAGGALLLLAAFSPFVLLRLVPMVEAGAVQQLESARHRAQHAVTAGPRAALRAYSVAQQLGVGAGSIDEALAGAGPVGSGADGALGTAVAGVPAWAGDTGSAEAFGAASPGGGSGNGGRGPGGGPVGGSGEDVPEGPAEGLTGMYSGPVPVLVGAGAPVEEHAGSPAEGHRRAGEGSPPGRVGPPVRTVVEHDEMGPTLRFVTDDRPSATRGRPRPDAAGD
jgi:hypothetical protein